MNKILLFLCLILVSCSTKEKPKTIPLTRVEAAQAEEKEVPIYITAIGNILEHSIVQVRPQVQGILLKAYVTQGQDVKAGDLLYEIDPNIYEAALEQAIGTLNKNKATLEQAKITVKRNSELVDKNYIPKLTFEQYETAVKTAEADVAIAQAEVKRAQINLNYCRITSPINGKISAFNVYPGTLVIANDPQAITEIRELDPIDVQFSIAQTEFQKMQQVQANWPLTFEATLPKEPEKKFIGKISFIDNHIDLNTGTLLLKGMLNNTDKRLWPGEFVHIRIFLKKELHALIIPESAVQIGAKGSYVYVVQSDKSVRITPVETGAVVDRNIVILSGLKVGDTVVTNGQINLKNESRVEVIVKDQSK
jgi:multidrug efflux system membrane fusion protein